MLNVLAFPIERCKLFPVIYYNKTKELHLFNILSKTTFTIKKRFLNKTLEFFHWNSEQ